MHNADASMCPAAHVAACLMKTSSLCFMTHTCTANTLVWHLHIADIPAKGQASFV